MNAANVSTGFFYPGAVQVNGTKQVKRRPGTASRKSQVTFSKKQGYGALQTS